MIPAVRARQLETLADKLFAQGGGMILSGHPIDVQWPHGGTKTLDQLTARDLLEDAQAFRRDAAKLRKLYN